MMVARDTYMFLRIFFINIIVFTMLWIIQSFVFGGIRFAQGFPSGHWMLEASHNLGLILTFVIKWGLWVPFLLSVFFAWTLKKSSYRYKAIAYFSVLSIAAYILIASAVELAFDRWLNIKIPYAVDVFDIHKLDMTLSSLSGYVFALLLLKVFSYLNYKE